eukprot:6396054-Prymnesium_polylepis.3
MPPRSCLPAASAPASPLRCMRSCCGEAAAGHKAWQPAVCICRTRRNSRAVHPARTACLRSATNTAPSGRAPSPRAAAYFCHTPLARNANDSVRIRK